MHRGVAATGAQLLKLGAPGLFDSGLTGQVPDNGAHREGAAEQSNCCCTGLYLPMLVAVRL